MMTAEKIADLLMDIDPGLKIEGSGDTTLTMNRTTAMNLLQLLTKMKESYEASRPVQ